MPKWEWGGLLDDGKKYGYGLFLGDMHVGSIWGDGVVELHLGKLKNLGIFENENKAKKAVEQAALKWFDDMGFTPKKKNA